MKHTIAVVATVVMGAVTRGTAAGKLAEGVGLASAVGECRKYVGPWQGCHTCAWGEQRAPSPEKTYILHPTFCILRGGVVA